MNNLSDKKIITIDGPSASGKGTVAVKLASSLGWHILPSGNIYRAVALSMQQNNIDKYAEKHIVELARKIKIAFRIEENKLLSYLNGECIDDYIITNEIGLLASHIAQYDGLRQELLPVQRHFAQDPGLVAEGRDMGTVVFPHSFLKIYLDASATTRAKRRYLQLCRAGNDSISEKQVLNDIISRDNTDTTRKNAPLKQDAEASVIKTDNLPADEVVAKIIEFVRLQPVVVSNFDRRLK